MLLPRIDMTFSMPLTSDPRCKNAQEVEPKLKLPEKKSHD